MTKDPLHSVQPCGATCFDAAALFTSFPVILNLLVGVCLPCLSVSFVRPALSCVFVLFIADLFILALYLLLVWFCICFSIYLSLFSSILVCLHCFVCLFVL